MEHRNWDISASQKPLLMERTHTCTNTKTGIVKKVTRSGNGGVGDGSGEGYKTLISEQRASVKWIDKLVQD